MKGGQDSMTSLSTIVGLINLQGATVSQEKYDRHEVSMNTISRDGNYERSKSYAEDCDSGSNCDCSQGGDCDCTSQNCDD
jgi:hypothetical protein